jgi:hypothetical protein
MSTSRVRVLGASLVCRVDSNLRRFDVTNLTHHDHVRILAQECFQGRGKCQADLGVHIHLVNTRQVDFRRVFRGGDVPEFGVEYVQAGVQGYGFTATCGPGHQDHAVGLVQILHVQVFLERLVAQGVDAQLGAGRIQDTQHDLFTKKGGAGADAEIDGAVLGQLHLDAPILGHTPFGDIQARHDLEPGSDFL